MSDVKSQWGHAPGWNAHRGASKACLLLHQSPSQQSSGNSTIGTLHDVPNAFQDLSNVRNRQALRPSRFSLFSTFCCSSVLSSSSSWGTRRCPWSVSLVSARLLQQLLFRTWPSGARPSFSAMACSFGTFETRGDWSSLVSSSSSSDLCPALAGSSSIEIVFDKNLHCPSGGAHTPPVARRVSLFRHMTLDHLSSGQLHDLAGRRRFRAPPLESRIATVSSLVALDAEINIWHATVRALTMVSVPSKARASGGRILRLPRSSHYPSPASQNFESHASCARPLFLLQYRRCSWLHPPFGHLTILLEHFPLLDQFSGLPFVLAFTCVGALSWLASVFSLLWPWCVFVK